MTSSNLLSHLARASARAYIPAHRTRASHAPRSLSRALQSHRDAEGAQEYLPSFGRYTFVNNALRIEEKRERKAFQLLGYGPELPEALRLGLSTYMATKVILLLRTLASGITCDTGMDMHDKCVLAGASGTKRRGAEANPRRLFG
jgi:hypothetical protein